MNKLQKGLLAVGVTLACSGQAMASPAFAAGSNNFFLQDFENLYRASASCVAAQCLAATPGDPAGFQRINPALANNVAVGDIFVGILNVQNITSVASGTDTYNSAPGNRFTGYFAQRVATIAPPVAGHATAHITLGTAVDPFGILAAGEMFRLYANTVNFSSGGSATNVTANIALATSGAFWASLGLPGGTDGYAYSHADLTTTIAQSSVIGFVALNVITKGGAYNAGILNKINDPATETEVGGTTLGQVCTPAEIASPTVSCTDFTGVVRIDGNAGFGATSPWMFQSNDPFAINVVPEPGSLALFGLALAGLGASIRRRKSA